MKVRQCLLRQLSWNRTRAATIGRSKNHLALFSKLGMITKLKKHARESIAWTKMTSTVRYPPSGSILRGFLKVIQKETRNCDDKSLTWNRLCFQGKEEMTPWPCQVRHHKSRTTSRNSHREFHFVPVNKGLIRNNDNPSLFVSVISRVCRKLLLCARALISLALPFKLRNLKDKKL